MNSPVAPGSFHFGKNWLNFLRVIQEEHIQSAVRSLQQLLSLNDLAGKRFLDVGCGSGLFSLAATRLGAQVYSVDYDPDAVACASELKKRFAPDAPQWIIQQGSALDPAFLSPLGSFDIVYSWGVLHHTGAMWSALENVTPLVAPEGTLAIAIYNDQGGASRRWKKIKKFYNQIPGFFKLVLVLGLGAFFEIRAALIRVAKFENPLPFKDWARRKHERGMTVWYDLVDWVGGYPFEVATPEAIFNFYFQRSFTLVYLKTCGGGLGCNEFVFRKNPGSEKNPKRES
jgi:2-polyprenyl-6-hydroxyphenyl methylase/3-demethylubiquinone-9 3-methyltransferase